MTAASDYLGRLVGALLYAAVLFAFGLWISRREGR